MAAPILQAQGATVAVTAGAPSVVIPTHQTDDIIIIAAIFWGPNTVGDAVQIPTPANYILIGSQVEPIAGNGWLAWFWRRAPSAATTVTLARGAGWDTGTDTCFGARAYVIRGCIATGDPWDAQATSGPHTTANQAFPAVTVSGSERMVVQFGNVTDNLAFAMTSSGWTTGTEDNDPAGTDCSFQTARKDNVSSSTTADIATVTAPAAGAYAFRGISFKPPSAVTVALTGVAASAAVGIVGVALSLALSGILGTGSVGLAAPESSLAVTGISSTISPGAVSPEISIALTGISGTGAVGTVTPDQGVTAALTGVSASGSVGTVSPGSAISITGNSSSGAVGTPSPSTDAALTGVSATASPGAVGRELALPISGNAITGAAGSLAPNLDIGLSGAWVTGSPGTTVPSNSPALIGVSATGTTGTVTAPENIIVSITGVSATTSIGSLSASQFTPRREIEFKVPYRWTKFVAVAPRYNEFRVPVRNLRYRVPR